MPGAVPGRNLIYLLRKGYEVCAADANAQGVDKVRNMARQLAPSLPASNFRTEAVEHLSFDDSCADVVISSAVLHFARDDAHFESMLLGSWRVLKPGGLFFCRLASSIGIEDQVERIEGRRYKLPDGSSRYLVDEGVLHSFTERLGELADPHQDDSRPESTLDDHVGRPKEPVA